MRRRILIATLATPGFVFSSLAVAERLRAAGHDVAFVTDLGYADAISARGFVRIPRGTGDGRSFQLDGWGDPLQIALQVRHLEYAILTFRPDAILSSNLAMGPLLVGRAYRVPVAVLGSVVFLWPGTRVLSDAADAETERRLRWRYDDQLRHLEAAAACLELPAFATFDFERSPLFGDRFLIQGVPELQRDAASLPAACRFVGSCADEALDAPDAGAVAWLRAQNSRHRALLYVQLGRTFDQPTVWEAFRSWVVARDVAAIVCSERHDRELGDVPENVLVRARIAQDAVLPFADAVVCTGHPTAVLGAAAHGVPLVIAPNGSGTEEIAEACSRFGAAIVPDGPAGSSGALTAALDRVLSDVAMRDAARRLQTHFAAYDGPATVCRELEQLATPSAVAGAAS